MNDPNTFRFENFEIWQMASALNLKLFDLARKAENDKKYRFVNQLYGASMSVANNIAEGTGSSTKKEFARYLSIARSSIFEIANILHILEQIGLIRKDEKSEVYNDLVLLSKKIYFFRKKLLNPTN